jgi:hypothetical protein
MVDNNQPTQEQMKQMQEQMSQMQSVGQQQQAGVAGATGIPTAQPQGNPLVKHLRQPKIYIKLPSEGNFWPGNSLEKTETGEYPVYAMTAKDEITFKTPDALLNGQATVDVVQSCIPNIKDAWKMPSIDSDAILIAIRMASFGNTIDMSAVVPNTDITKDFALDLQTIFDRYQSAVYEDTFEIPGFKVQIKPVDYKTMTSQALKAFEQQRIFAIVNNDSIDDKEKLERFQASFKNLTEININVVINSVVAIQPNDSDEAVVNTKYIREFLENCDATVYNGIQDHIAEQKDKFTQAPLDVNATDEELAAGAPKTYQIPVQFDQSNFFG